MYATGTDLGAGFLERRVRRNSRRQKPLKEELLTRGNVVQLSFLVESCSRPGCQRCCRLLRCSHLLSIGRTTSDNRSCCFRLQTPRSGGHTRGRVQTHEELLGGRARRQASFWRHSNRIGQNLQNVLKRGAHSSWRETPLFTFATRITDRQDCTTHPPQIHPPQPQPHRRMLFRCWRLAICRRSEHLSFLLTWYSLILLNSIDPFQEPEYPFGVQ